MARYGKSAKKKKTKKSSVSNVATPKPPSEPIFNPSKYAENLKDTSLKPGQRKPITEADMRKMGFDQQEVKMMEDAASIKSLSPFMAVARCCKTMKFAKGGEKVYHQTLSKGEVYVMALGMYDSLRHNQNYRGEVLKPYKFKFSDVFRRYEGQDLTDKNLLIWRTGGIGDLLFIKPNMDWLKKTYPTCKIWFACAPSYQNMVKHWDCVDKLVDLPIDYYKIFSKANYHVTFEGAIERNLEAHKVNAYKMFSDWMGLNLEDDDLIPHQDPPAPLLPKVSQILKTWGMDPTAKEFVLLQMAPSSPIRMIAIDKWIEVINELTSRGHKVVITDSPIKADNVQNIINQCKDKDKLFNFAKHSESLDYTIALCSMAKGTVGPDSSLCHIAGSLSIPTVGIFGPFVGEIRLSYFPTADWINCERECAPCFLHGNDPCVHAQKEPDKMSPCLKNFEAKTVCDKLEKLIDENQD
jgi:ADP-heptose:LPS heptosyltransferase